MKLALLAVLAALALPAQALATTYYVSPSGNDTAVGTSPDHAWATVQAVNGHPFVPGDNILFEGGKTFAGPLWPSSSGSADAPITFGSYGDGLATISDASEAVVWLHGRSYVTLDHLHLDGAGGQAQLVLSSSGTGIGVVIRNCLLENTRSYGINSSSLSDANWTIEDNQVSHIGASGITWRGAGFTVSGNRITDVGFATTWHDHGIYAKGPTPRIVDNTISGFPTNGISIRYQSSYVVGNRISGGPIGIAFFQESSVPGTTRIAYNTITGVSEAGIYLDRAPLESFVIASNTIQTGSSGPALNASPVRSLTVANNVLASGRRGPWALQVRRPFGRYSESHDLLWPASAEPVLWNGKGKSLAEYTSKAHAGDKDLVADPAHASVVDLGVRALLGLRYVARCDGRPFHYCGSAPDLGAVEAPH